MCIEIQKLFQLHGENVALISDFSIVEIRGLELHRSGMGIADAMHVAYAEACVAEFITCDDDLLAKCRRNNVKIWYGYAGGFWKKGRIIVTIQVRPQNPPPLGIPKHHPKGDL